MDFSFTQEQVLLRNSVQRFVQDKYSFEARKAILASEEGWRRENWRAFAELGLLAVFLGVPPVAALPFVTAGVAWVNEYVALAGARGLLIGAAIGAFVAGVRVLLGFDTPYIDR